MRKTSLLLFAFAAFLVTGCYYDKAELVYPTATVANCDTITPVKYSTDVVNILRANCYVCHSGNAAAGGGNILDTYNGVKVVVNNTKLLKAITHSPGAVPMPQGGTKLPECNIAKIRTWIRNGAPNN